MSLHQVIPETERLAYLETLGVTSWLPIEGEVDSYGCFFTHEPVAAGEQLLDDVPTLPIETQGVAPGEPAQTPTAPVDEPPPMGLSVQQVQQQAAQMRADLVADVAVPESTPAVVSEVPVESAVDAPVAERVEPLHLSISWYQSGVLVINELPLQDGAAMSGALAQLQTAMINALGLGVKEVMPQTQAEFFWPLVPGPHGDRSKAGGCDALAYQMSKLLQDKPLSRVMLLGQRSVELLAAGDLEFGQVGELCIWPEAKVLLTHSLHQLLKIPANKAEAWRHMQPLLASND